MATTLHWIDAPNPDFAPRIKCATAPESVREYDYAGNAFNYAVKKARRIHSNRPTGRTYITEIAVDGRWFNVSGNGRVWEGRSREWTSQTRMVLDRTEEPQG